MTRQHPHAFQILGRALAEFLGGIVDLVASLGEMSVDFDVEFARGGADALNEPRRANDDLAKGEPCLDSILVLPALDQGDIAVSAWSEVMSIDFGTAAPIVSLWSMVDSATKPRTPTSSAAWPMLSGCGPPASAKHVVPTRKRFV